MSRFRIVKSHADFIGDPTILGVRVEASSESAAAVEALAALGYAVSECDEPDEGESVEAYRERQDPGVLRAGDADRGGCR